MIEVSAEARSRIMRAVKGRDTGPEIIVRRLVFSMGYRYILHRADLPGKPDLAFMGRRKVVFVHGCFWHGHECVRGAREPKANREYWVAKIARNRDRDRRDAASLSSQGWKILVIWECELKDLTRVRDRLAEFLTSRNSK